MEFNEKLQELRRQKGMTQEELAQALYVSRTAVSKWESGRGYPSIDSLKAIARFFSVTVDMLLSGDEILTIAEEDQRQKQTRLRALVFGLLDCGVSALLFLPFFRQQTQSGFSAVSLLALTGLSPVFRGAYLAAVLALTLCGVGGLALPVLRRPLRGRNPEWLSLFCSAGAVLLFILSPQPYAAAILFFFLMIKVILLLYPR
jgi:transcriptional regulator with XRE-family HTH domain